MNAKDASRVEAGIVDDHDHGGGHGHAHDPNAGVVKGEPPTPAWVATAGLIALVTVLACVWLAFAIG